MAELGVGVMVVVVVGVRVLVAVGGDSMGVVVEEEVGMVEGQEGTWTTLLCLSRILGVWSLLRRIFMLRLLPCGQ